MRSVHGSGNETRTEREQKRTNQEQTGTGREQTMTDTAFLHGCYALDTWPGLWYAWDTGQTCSLEVGNGLPNGADRGI